MNQPGRQDQLARVLAEKYQVICPIRTGGMAEVYLARNRFLGSFFAIKVLSDTLANEPSLVARFEHEGRMAASLSNHPNIVTIFDIGASNGLHFLIMQFVAGEDLGTYLKREGKLPLWSAANIIAQIAEALSCAESKGIVHRDVKPANILLDESGRAKLVDFGISKVRDSLDGLTRPGETFGTPAYMSPEQVNGQTCDMRSDLYSLGAVFFELLSGRPPFLEDSSTAVLIAHLNRTPPSLMELDPGIPEICDRIIQKLLAKDPHDRYQSALELQHDLLAYGASSGPGDLRPVVNAKLQKALDEANAVPLCDSERITIQTDPEIELPQPSVTPTQVQKATHAPSETTRPIAAVSAPMPPERAPSSIWLLVGALLVTAILIVAAILYTASRRSSVPLASLPHDLPPTISDSHGRMLLIPEGTFQFGSVAGHTLKAVQLPAYYIDETEVSNDEYRRFCEATGHSPPATNEYATEPNAPVSGVSYSDATAYAAWAGRRLPTEEEWEKAARGSDGRTYPWGNEPWTGAVPSQLQPVDSTVLPRSPSGAYNMAGNVWEWTATAYTPTPDDGSNMALLLHSRDFSSDWRITKGGSFGPRSGQEFDLSKHRPLPVDARSPWIGFRCVKSANSN